MTTLFDPLLVLRTLVAHQVRFLIVGGFAGTLWGSPSITIDLDVEVEVLVAVKEEIENR